MALDFPEIIKFPSQYATPFIRWTFHDDLMEAGIFTYDDLLLAFQGGNERVRRIDDVKNVGKAAIMVAARMLVKHIVAKYAAAISAVVQRTENEYLDKVAGAKLHFKTSTENIRSENAGMRIRIIELERELAHKTAVIEQVKFSVNGHQKL